MKDSEVIAAARELITDPEKWITGDWCVGPGYPVIKNGETVRTVKEKAYCAEGAVYAVLGKYGSHMDRTMAMTQEEFDNWVWNEQQATRVIIHLDEVATDFSPYDVDQSVQVFNDHQMTRHQDVLDLFDKARISLEEKGF